MKTVKQCKNCRHGSHNNFNSDIVCRYKGVVSRDYSCGKFKPLPDGAIKLFGYRCIDCNFLILDPENEDSDYGFCQLFTVSKFDGSKKSVCSKFSLRDRPGA